MADEDGLAKFAQIFISKSRKISPSEMGEY
jgi:hypothetical protein